MKTVNVSAWALRSALFALADRFKNFELSLQFAQGPAGEVANLVASANTGARLASLCEELHDLYIDAARDSKDQSYPWTLSDDAIPAETAPNPLAGFSDDEIRAEFARRWPGDFCLANSSRPRADRGPPSDEEISVEFARRCAAADRDVADRDARRSATSGPRDNFERDMR